MNTNIMNALKSFDIMLLKPTNHDVALSIDSPHHYSKWDFNNNLSGLKEVDFSNEEKNLIQILISENKWIEEESLDLLTLVKI